MDKLIALILSGVVSVSANTIAEHPEKIIVDQESGTTLEDIYKLKKQERIEEEAWQAYLEAERQKQEQIEKEKLEQERLEQERMEEYNKTHPTFRTYDLTVDEITQIAKLCYQEQGSVIGAATEASLIANRFEEYGWGYDSIVSYAKKCGWFANANYYMTRPFQLDEEVYDVVKLVLMDGIRILPRYVTNHDCTSDISYVSSYPLEQDVTVLHNVYGETSIYYTTAGDHFSYSDMNLVERIKSEYPEGYMDHYTYDYLYSVLHGEKTLELTQN